MEMTVSIRRMHVPQCFPGHRTKFILHVPQQPVVREQRGRIALLNGFAALQETVLLSLFVSKQRWVTVIDFIEREIEYNSELRWSPPSFHNRDDRSANNGADGLRQGLLDALLDREQNVF